MNLDSIIYFIHVAETESYTEAADDLYISVSTVSKSISKLEEELGVPLFIRGRKGNKLTKYGKIFYKFAKESVIQLEEGRDILQNLADVVRGEISFGVIPSLSIDYVSQILKKFRELYPDLNIHYGAYHSDILYNYLSIGDLSLCLGPSSSEFETDANIDGLSLFEEEFSLLVSNDHPLSHSDSIRFSDLQGQDLIGYFDDSTYYHIFSTKEDRQFITDNINSNFYVKDETTMLGAIEAGLGIGFVPRKLIISGRNVQKKSIADRYFYRTIHLFWNKSMVQLAPVRTMRDYFLTTIMPD